MDQTHHRGQVSVLLSQAGQHLDSTDLLVLIPSR
ncbi:DinB family protein [Synechococcus sp. PCC 6312]